MKRPKRLQIEPFRKWGWGKRAVIFSTALGFLWLILDSLFAFIGQDNPITAFGIWGYIVFIATAIIITIISEQLTIQRIPNEVSTVNFTVIITESGQRYPITVPHDMRISDFLKRFAKQTSSHAEKGSMLSHIDMFQTRLLVARNDARDDNYTAVESQLTLREAGVREGDVCKIRTTIRQDYTDRELET